MAVGLGVPRGGGDAGGEGTWSWGELQGCEIRGPAPVCVGTAMDTGGCMGELQGDGGLEGSI